MACFCTGCVQIEAHDTGRQGKAACGAGNVIDGILRVSKAVEWDGKRKFRRSCQCSPLWLEAGDGEKAAGRSAHFSWRLTAKATPKSGFASLYTLYMGNPEGGRHARAGPWSAWGSRLPCQKYHHRFRFPGKARRWRLQHSKRAQLWKSHYISIEAIQWQSSHEPCEYLPSIHW